MTTINIIRYFLLVWKRIKSQFLYVYKDRKDGLFPSYIFADDHRELQVIAKYILYVHHGVQKYIYRSKVRITDLKIDDVSTHNLKKHGRNAFEFFEIHSALRSDRSAACTESRDGYNDFNSYIFQRFLDYYYLLCSPTLATVSNAVIIDAAGAFVRVLH